MSIASLVIGESGTGKTASLRNLDPSQTLVIQSIKKPLSFKKPGWAHRTKDNPSGNVFVTDNPDGIIHLMQKTSKKIIVIDDFQYVMANEYMRRSDETGFTKFTQIGRNVWNIFNESSALPDDVRVYILSHTATDDMGRTKFKTVGKMLDEKITCEGMFSIVLKTVRQGGEYQFATRNNGSDTTKTPLDMFSEDFIENDLAMVDKTICEYFDVKQ